MQCAKHPDHEAAGMCAYSGKPFCTHELVEVQGRMYGKDYLDKVFAEAKEASKPQQVFMSGGGSSSSAASTTVVVGGPARKRPINHAFHILMSVCTLGVWLPFYLLMVLLHSC